MSKKKNKKKNSLRTEEVINTESIDNEETNKNINKDVNENCETIQAKKNSEAISEAILKEDTLEHSQRNKIIEIKNKIVSLVKRKNILFGTIVGAVVFVILFILIVVPIIKYNNGIKELKANNYTQSYKILSSINYRDSNELCDIAEEKMVNEIANHILMNDLSLKGDGLKLKSVNNYKVIAENKLLKINYDAIYENSKYELYGSYYAEKSLDSNNEWIITNYNTLSSVIKPFNELDQKIVDDYVSEKFIDCMFERIETLNTTTRNYVYSYVSEDEPYVLYNYKVIATYEYDKANGKWKPNDLYCQFVDKEDAKLEEKHTSYFSFKLPESWKLEYLNEDEEYMSFCYRSGMKNGNYDRDFADVSFYVYKKDKYSQIKEKDAEANHGLGAGSYKQNNGNFSGEFYPMIDGDYRIMSISAYGLTEQQFKDFFASLKLKRTTYSIKVKADVINIRKNPSTYADIVGKVRKGNLYTATYKKVSYDGYTWYMIGEDQWIADEDGEWLEVTDR